MKFREVFEELVIAIDQAGALQGDNMYFVANPQSFAPDTARSIEEMFVNFGCNVDQLGMSVGIAILDGAAFPDGPHHIILGSAGGQDIDISNNMSRARPLMDMGIRVKGGAQYTVTFIIDGDTVDEGICAIEIIFDEKAPRAPKHWVYAGIETAVVNTPVQTNNIAQVVEGMSSDGSGEIGGLLKTAARQNVELGAHAGVMILSGGVSPRQEILMGAGASELITAPGDNAGVSQEFDCQIPCDKKKLIQIMSVGVGEAGTIMNGLSVGFKV